MADTLDEELMPEVENNATIREGKHVVLKSGSNIKLMKVEKNRKVVFERHHFFLDSIVGHLFGSVFEVDRDKLKLCEPEDNIDHLTAAKMKNEVVNQPIKTDGESQKLSRDDIESLKAQGVRGKDIVDQLVQNSSTFNDRTEYSKAKYKTRKSKKHMTRYTVLKPTTSLIAEALYYAKDSQRICDLRPDALSQILTMANIRANTRNLVMEQCQGLVLGAVMDRMGGMGSLVHVYNGDFPSRFIIEHFNFPAKYMDILNGFPINKINSLMAETESETTGDQQRDIEEKQLPSEQSSKDTEFKTKAEQDRYDRKQNRLREEIASRKELLTGQMDSLVIVCKFIPSPVLLALLPFLAPSRPFVVFSQYKEPLMACYVNLRAEGGVVNLQLTETWLRYYQVLPSRTHPNVNMNASGGYLLSGITVVKDKPNMPIKTSTPTTNVPKAITVDANTKDAPSKEVEGQQKTSSNPESQTLVEENTTSGSGTTETKTGSEDSVAKEQLSETCSEPVAKKPKTELTM